MVRRKTIFFPAKYKRYEEIVTFKNPKAAEGASETLMREFDKAKTHDKKLRIARVTQLASNRAEASAEKTQLSDRERKELRQVSAIYDSTANDMFRKL